MSNQEIARQILIEQGFNRDNYQGDEYRDGTGDLNDYKEASEEMFAEWVRKTLESWPQLDKASERGARMATINAINYLWRVG